MARRARDMARCWSRLHPLVPWGDIAPSDVREANEGQVELYRDLSIDGRPERHLAMLVVGQYDRSLALGLVAVRCERHGEQLIPLTCSIPETPATAIAVREPCPLQSNPRRVTRWRDEDDGA